MGIICVLLFWWLREIHGSAREYSADSSVQLAAARVRIANIPMETPGTTKVSSGKAVVGLQRDRPRE